MYDCKNVMTIRISTYTIALKPSGALTPAQGSNVYLSIEFLFAA